ncbi:MAG: ABC transporter permease subunit [Spirochaetota bacterium]|nr:ABC transporter permease subunit [Spirochaetota bacterium]
MNNLKGELASVIKINGLMGRYVKYALYFIYLLIFIGIWQINIGTALRPFSEVFAKLSDLFLKEFFMNKVIESIELSLMAIAISLSITLIFSYLATMPMFRPWSLIITKGRFLGVLGIYFIFIGVFGLGFHMKVALLTFGITVFFLTSMYSIITEIPQSRFDYARSLGLSEIQVFWQVVIRGTADQMLESLRQNAAIGWMMIPAVENIVKSGGIGDVLWDNVKHFDRSKTLAIVFVIIIIGIIQDILLKMTQRVVTPHVTVKK